jgi:hypothetical protein
VLKGTSNDDETLPVRSPVQRDGDVRFISSTLETGSSPSIANRQIAPHMLKDFREG